MTPSGQGLGVLIAVQQSFHCCRQELISWSGQCVDEMVIDVVPARRLPAFPSG